MKKPLILLLFVPLVFSSCEKEENESTFLETHSEKMWSLLTYESYIGFSNNKSESLFYQVEKSFNSYDYNCFTYKEGENVIQPECTKYNSDGGLINGDEAVVIYSIIENTQKRLILDAYTIDFSCESTFEFTTRSTYSVDGDFLYASIAYDGIDGINDLVYSEYSLSTKSHDELCN